METYTDIGTQRAHLTQRSLLARALARAPDELAAARFIRDVGLERRVILVKYLRKVVPERRIEGALP